MLSIVEKIATAKFTATEAQIEQLAAVVATGVQAGGTYLRVVLVAVQAALGRPRGRKPRDLAAIVTAQDAALNKVHERFYPHVLSGVGGEGVDKHRRANFARSTVSTLRKVVRAGHDLRTLDAATVSKASLRKLVAPAEPADRTQRLIVRSEATLMRALGALVQRDAVAAEEVMERINAEFDALIPADAPPVQTEQPNITAHRVQRMRLPQQRERRQPLQQQQDGHH